MIGPLIRALRQAGDPVFLGVLVRSVVLAAVCFGGLALSCGWLLERVLAGHGALTAIVGWLGGAASLLLALWLFVPVAAGIASLFIEPICRAVEQRWYPSLPPARGAPVRAQIGDALWLGLRVLALSVVGLCVTLVLPGVGLVIAFAVNSWAIGRGLFVAVAMRRMTRDAARDLCRARKLAVLALAGLFVGAGSVPLLNLLVPVLGTASMVHLVERARSGVRREHGDRA
jgi:uncharacterized protein involved in cysteine biosynthesis